MIELKDCFFKKGTALCKCAFKDGEIDITLYTSQKHQLKHLGWIVHPNGDDTEFSFCRLSLCRKCDKISCESLYSGTELTIDFATGVYCKLYQSAVQNKPNITHSEEAFVEAFTDVLIGIGEEKAQDVLAGVDSSLLFKELQDIFK